jgi:acyl-CoA thioesterase FadM
MSRALKIILTILKSRFAAPLDPSAEWRTSGRVWPFDTDLTIVNNSVYFFYFELARWEYIYRTSALKHMRATRSVPLVTSQSIRIVRPMRRFQKFTVISKLSFWDSKSVYIDQRIESGGKLVAYGFVKGVIRGPDGVVPIESVIQGWGIPFFQPPPDERFDQFNRAEDLTFERIHNSSNRA